MRKMFFIFIVLVLLSSCSTWDEALDAIEDGAGYEGIVDVMGRPQGYSNKDGVERIEYYSVYTNADTLTGADFYIEFEDDEVLSYGKIIK